MSDERSGTRRRYAGQGRRAAGCTGSTRVVSPYLYVGSFFVIFRAFGLFPLGYTAYVSLTDRNLLDPTTHFVGLDNYTALLHDSYFWNAVENTLGIWVISTVPQLLLALAPRAPPEHEASGADVLPDERPAPAGDVARRGRADLHAALLPRLRPVQLHARRDRDQPGRLGGRPLLVVGGALGDGHLAVDGLQRPDLPRRDAGDPGRPLRVRGDRRRAAAGSSSGTSPCR